MVELVSARAVLADRKWHQCFVRQWGTHRLCFIDQQLCDGDGFGMAYHAAWVDDSRMDEVRSWWTQLGVAGETVVRGTGTVVLP